MEITVVTVIAFIVGLVIGFIVKSIIGSVSSSNTCPSELNKVRKDYRDYQHQVSRHLKQTADMINTIQSQYGEVQSQIFTAAQELNKDDGKQNALQPHSHFVSYGDEPAKIEEPKSSDKEPPRDYAG